MSPDGSWRSILLSLIEAGLNLIYPQPPVCPLCGTTLGWDSRVTTWLCPDCQAMVHQWHQDFYACAACGRLLPRKGEPTLAVPSGLCWDCSHQRPPFVVARALGPYQDQLKDAVWKLKYQGRRDLAEPLGRLMARVAWAEPHTRQLASSEQKEQWPMVIPVPLHSERLRERTYNQAALLARALGRELGLPVREDLLLRMLPTPDSTGLTREQRERSVRGAFQVISEDANAGLKGRPVLLVDDVYTTGATVGECARTLLAAGARQVMVITLATGITRPPASTVGPE